MLIEDAWASILVDVAQPKLYVSDQLAEELRLAAEAEGKSLSEFVVDKISIVENTEKAFGAAFWAQLAALGPMPDDFVAPARDEAG